MLHKPYTVNIELYNALTLRSGIRFVADDRHVYPLTIKLRSKSEPFAIVPGSVAEIIFELPSGESFPRIAKIVDAEKGELLYNILPGDIFMPGVMTAAVSIISSERRLTWGKFNFSVLEGASEEQIEPPDVLKPWRDEITGALSEHGGRITELEEGGTGGGSCVTFPSAGFFTMYVDENGKLFAFVLKDGIVPLEYNAGSGNLYYLAKRMV